MAKRIWEIEAEGSEGLTLARIVGFADTEIGGARFLLRRDGADAVPYTQQWTLLRFDRETPCGHRDFGGPGGRDLPPELMNLS